jgi:large subunit ribosomal protein L4
LRNPQFRGGGVAFGPTGEENYSTSLNKKLKKKSLQNVLCEKLRNNEIFVFDNISLDSCKTKEAKEFLKVLPNSSRSRVLLILSVEEKDQKNTILSFRNLPNIEISNSRMTNFLQVASSKYMIVSKTALLEIENRIE